ncbi:hypothetical protein CC79DRAFT_189870 [Sarocladium strictum]
MFDWQVGEWCCESLHWPSWNMPCVSGPAEQVLQIDKLARGGRQHLKLSVQLQHFAYLVSCSPLPRQGHYVHFLSPRHPRYLFEMTAISLNNVSFWTPPSFQGVKDPSRCLQRHPEPSFSPDLPPLPTQGQFKEPWTQSSQTQDDPISILSNADSVVSPAERRYTDEDDGEDSDSTLPSISSIVASRPKARPGKSSRRATETEASAGVDPASAVSPRQAGATLAWPDEA